jgi:hypothetical protein
MGPLLLLYLASFCRLPASEIPLILEPALRQCMNLRKGRPGGRLDSSDFSFVAGPSSACSHPIFSVLSSLEIESVKSNF